MYGQLRLDFYFTMTEVFAEDYKEKKAGGGLVKVQSMSGRLCSLSGSVCRGCCGL